MRKTRRIEKGGQKRNLAIFLCSACGKESEKVTYDGKKAKTCGCNKRGDLADGKRPRIYQTWSDMKRRCYYKKYTGYHNYGGRGITVCEEWYYFQNFKKWALENGYNDKLTIDRIDNDGNYEPSNCQFVTNGCNASKRRNLKLNFEIAEEIRKIYKKGELTHKDLGLIYGVDSTQIGNIVNFKQWKTKLYK